MSSLRRARSLQRCSVKAGRVEGCYGWCAAQTASAGRLVAAATGVGHAGPFNCHIACHRAREARRRGSIASRLGTPTHIGVSAWATGCGAGLSLRGACGSAVGIAIGTHEAVAKKGRTHAIAAGSALAHMPACAAIVRVSRGVRTGRSSSAAGDATAIAHGGSATATDDRTPTLTSRRHRAVAAST